MKVFLEVQVTSRRQSVSPEDPRVGRVVQISTGARGGGPEGGPGERTG